MDTYRMSGRGSNIFKNIDLTKLKEKGLSEEKISEITKLPINFIHSYFHRMDQYREKSGVF